MRNDAASCVRSVVCSRVSCHPDSVPDVSERIICAMLRPLMAPSWKLANTVPPRFDRMARWLDPVERTAIFACSLPSSLSKSAALFNSGSARTDQIAGERIRRIAAGHIDGELSAGVAAIGTQIGKSAFEDAAGERGVD